MKKKALKMKQFDLEFYVINLRPSELIEYSIIPFFNSETEEGYQRPLNPLHSKSIAKFLLNNNNPIMISSILGAVDEDQIQYNPLTKEIEIKGNIRIVDGQHRIKALKLVKENNSDKFEIIDSIDYPITLLCISEGQQIYEINTFIDINSKGKKVNTDLAIRLRSKIRTEQNSYNEKSEVLEEIGKVITDNLNKDINSIWYESIKDSPEKTNKIITLNAFSKSLIDLIKYNQDFKNEFPSNFSNEKISEISFTLSDMVSEAWEIISEKWKECFTNKVPAFNKSYSLQKGIGVNTMHIILAECYRSTNGNEEMALIEFEQILSKSNIEAKQWESGGNFSGYSSKAGFKDLSNKIIRN